MEGIGLALNAFLMVPLIQDLFTTGAPRYTAAVKFGIGLRNDTLYAATFGGGDPGLGGDTPYMPLFNTNSQFLGESGSRVHLDEDSSPSNANSIKVATNTNSQPEYMTLSAGGNDAVCIAYLTITWPDGSQFFWRGDVGFKCGADWYPFELDASLVEECH
jgi:hypothetical protein